MSRIAELVRVPMIAVTESEMMRNAMTNNMFELFIDASEITRIKPIKAIRVIGAISDALYAIAACDP